MRPVSHGRRRDLDEPWEIVVVRQGFPQHGGTDGIDAQTASFLVVILAVAG
jgi:hypothetical protein